MSLLELNRALFLAMNAPADAPPALISAATFAADRLAYLVPVAFIALWIWGAPRGRAALLEVFLATWIALGMAQIAGQIWFEPRPFMAGVGHTALLHAVDNSFPSDHATAIWTTALGLTFTGRSRLWGATLLVDGVIVSWARVYLGVHFPIDMVGALAIAMMCALAVPLLSRALVRWMCRPLESFYERILVLMRLPQALFPRSPA